MDYEYQPDDSSRARLMTNICARILKIHLIYDVYYLGKSCIFGQMWFSRL